MTLKKCAIGLWASLFAQVFPWQAHGASPAYTLYCSVNAAKFGAFRNQVCDQAKMLLETQTGKIVSVRSSRSKPSATSTDLELDLEIANKRSAKAYLLVRTIDQNGKLITRQTPVVTVSINDANLNESAARNLAQTLLSLSPWLSRL